MSCQGQSWNSFIAAYVREHKDTEVAVVHYQCQLLSRVRLFATPWAVAHQAPLSLGFSRQEYWSGNSHSFLQGIFPTQELNPGLLRCRQILYCLNHHGSPEASKRNQIKPTWSEYSLGKIDAKRNGRRGKNQARVKSLDFILIIDFYSVSDMICLQKRRRYVLIWRHSNIQKLCREDRTGKETEKIQLVTQSVVY